VGQAIEVPDLTEDKSGPLIPQLVIVDPEPNIKASTIVGERGAHIIISVSRR